MSADRYICIHGHFYQPPRENAWLEVVELQDSAAPFHDWNERINYECYAPNTAARILNKEDDIVKIVNNYSRISFNFGPTLLSWMEKSDPETYRAILEADRKSLERYNGHGSALAQVYGHLIMPLANRRDKETQVIWGIRDFEHRFGRSPEGMWLAETAVDTETLEILADHGIAYTILAPRQARSFRKIGDKEWKTPSGGIETRRPYRYSLPSGKEIALFFYDGDISQAVAFKGLLNNGKEFAKRLVSSFRQDTSPQLVHIATDGESYGHHHRYGEMALADCLHYIEQHKPAELINYGAYLKKFPPTYEVQIHEDSSWSCVHGVERWRANCGCNTGGHPGWTQEWRKPLRETLNWLRDELIPVFEAEGGQLLKDPWKARNEYIEVILDRREETATVFLEEHAKRELDQEETTRCLRLMEMQRHAQLMFTSCGWFFDEISGIETNQILQYANRTIFYAQELSGEEIHESFLERLRQAPSNVFANGAVSYEKNIVPSRVNLVRVGIHYAISSLFEPYPERLSFLNYLSESEVFNRYEAGNQRLVLGYTHVKSRVTLSQKAFSFAVLYLGQQNIIGNISFEMGRDTFDEMSNRLREAFKQRDLNDVIGLLQKYFGPEKYSIWHLFRDEKRKILKQITDESLEKVETAFREIYNDNYQLMTSISQSDIPLPGAFLNAVQFVLNNELADFFANGSFSIRDLSHLSSEFRKWKVRITEEQSLKLAAGERIFKEIRNIRLGQIDDEDLQNLNEVITTIRDMRVDLDLWKSQNIYWSLLGRYEEGDFNYPSGEWKEAMPRLPPASARIREASSQRA
ncbi:MAG: DUF3536 domain-containing protein, partial [Saprospiraceae bacterium]|nr:DUF3536 domain-containing protein [Saprospiraceae bacterium]